jgi:type IV secretory pathway VirB2 component (pilin)
MAKIIRIVTLLVILAAGALASGALSPQGGGVGRVAHAQTAPAGLSALENKVNDIAALIRRILYVFVGVGILFCGFRFIQGDPHAWRYTLTVVVGATIIFASGEILTWLQR